MGWAARLALVSVVTVSAACRKPAVYVQQPYPPAVLTGDAELVCNISSKENGHQKLTIVNGGGIEFDAVVSPILDGRVIQRGPQMGGAYQFTSHLAKPGQAALPGIGKFDLDELETKVAVEMKRYQQPAGRGHAANGERFTFRVTLGAPTDGKGTVVPVNDNETSLIGNKMVEIHAPTTTVLVTTRFERGL